MSESNTLDGDAEPGHDAWTDDNLIYWSSRLLFTLGWHHAQGLEATDPELEKLRSLGRFMALISEQDDRAMVLSMAAFVEETLGRMLLAYLRDCKATCDLVDGFNAPLGTLSARIKAAYSIGLIGEKSFRDLEILRRIRNHFAHDWEGVSLQRNDIAALIGQLEEKKRALRDGTSPWEQDGDRGKLLLSFTSHAMSLSIVEAGISEGRIVKGLDVDEQFAAAASDLSGRLAAGRAGSGV